MKRISATEAARNFSELLNHTHYLGTTYIITRNGEEVGRLAPVEKKCTLRGLWDLLEGLEVDEEFASDLAQIRSDQERLEEPWGP